MTHFNQPHIVYDRTVTVIQPENKNLVSVALGRQNEDVVDEFMFTRQVALELRDLLSTWGDL